MTNLLVHYVQHVCYSLPLRFWTTSQNYYQDRQACLHLNRPFKNCYIGSERTTKLVQCPVSDGSHKWVFRGNIKIGHTQSNLFWGIFFQLPISKDYGGYTYTGRHVRWLCLMATNRLILYQCTQEGLFWTLFKLLPSTTHGISQFNNECFGKKTPDFLVCL